MDRSKFIAGLAGPVFLSLGVSMLLNRDMFPDIVHQIQNSYPLVIVAGMIALVACLAIVQNHDTWSGWPAIITLIGWLLIIGGVLRIVFPRQLANIAGSIGGNPSLLMIPATLITALGLFLCVKAYR